MKRQSSNFTNLTFKSCSHFCTSHLVKPPALTPRRKIASYLWKTSYFSLNAPLSRVYFRISFKQEIVWICDKTPDFGFRQPGFKSQGHHFLGIHSWANCSMFLRSLVSSSLYREDDGTVSIPQDCGEDELSENETDMRKYLTQLS